MLLISWILISALSLCTAFSLAEICSAFPHGVGSVYLWTGKLAPPSYSPLLSYMVGMCILMGSLTNLATNTIAASSVIHSIFKVLVLLDSL